MSLGKSYFHVLELTMEPWIHCPTCDALRWRPNKTTNGAAILYCKHCDGTLEVPAGIWPINAKTQPVSTKSVYSPAPEGDSDEHAGAFFVPANVPDLMKLGPLLEVHRTQKVSIWQVIGVGALFLTIGGIGALSIYFESLNRLTVIMALYLPASFLAIPFLLYCFFYTRFAYQTILLFEGGLVRYRFGRVKVFPWDQIDVVFFYQAPLPELSDDLKEKFADAPLLVHRDGSKIHFADLDFAKRRKLDLHVMQEVRRHLMPLMMEFYESGKVVEFGNIGISKAGLSRGKKTLAWEDVGRVYIDIHLQLRVVRKGSVLRWFSRPVKRVPNFYLLRELIERHFPLEVQMAKY